MSMHFLRKLMLPALLNWCLLAGAQSLQPVSTLDPAEGPPPGGNGDSWGPIISSDGRYVLFASTADNLVVLSNHEPIPALIPATLNVFLRDRSTRTTTLVSVNATGTGGGNGDSLPIALSTNGQYALFESSASDLVAGDANNGTDVFIRDLVAGKTVLVSVNTSGTPGNGESRSSTMSPDGRYVAFVSAATDLVSSDTNGIPDIFVRDLQLGTTVLASASAVSTNTSVPLGSSESPVITPDGRYVAFFSTATGLVPGVPPGGDVYVRDLLNKTTVWGSTGARVVVSNILNSTSAVSYNQVLSDDGRFLVYEASPSFGYAGLLLRYDLSTGTTDLLHTNAMAALGAFEDFHSIDITSDGQTVVFIANTNDYATTCLQLWKASTGNCTLVSGDQDGQVAPGSTCEWPTVDSTGRFLVFQSSNPNLTTNVLAADYHLYRRDLVTGETVLIDVDTNGVGAGVSPATAPSPSTDGSKVAFDCGDANLVPNDRNHDSDVFVRDLSAGATELMSAHDPTLPTRTGNGPSFVATTSISGDGRYIAFASEADNLVPQDTNECRDVFVWDMTAGKTVLVSVDTNGFSGDATSTEPSISSDGRFVGFTSSAENLVPGDNNNSQDVFLRDLVSGTTTLVSWNSNGVAVAARSSYSPMVATGGRYVLFRSMASNLAPGVFTGENLFVRDMQMGINYALTQSGVGSAAMTPDGRYVVYADASFSPKLHVWSSQTTSQVYTSTIPPVFGVAISADGMRIAAGGSAGLYRVDWTISSSRMIETNTFGYASLGLSSDGRWLACVRKSSLSSSNQVYLYDLEAGTKVMVSHSYVASIAPDAAADSPRISPDGRFVAYRSAATNLVPNDSNGVPDVFLYDATTGLNTLLTTSVRSATSANNRSLTPVFSGDGRLLCFTSWASDLTDLDFNQASDVFAFSFLFASVLPANSPGQGPWISWPYTPGKNYRVQFRDDLGGAAWTDLSGTATNNANKAYLQDTAPSAGKRFYRVLSY